MKPTISCGNCTECCSYIPISQIELAKVRRAVRNMPQEEQDRLSKQKRSHNVCPLVDTENNRCSIYNDRPSVCVKFGYFEGLQCSYNKHIPLESMNMEEGIAFAQEQVGHLGMDYTWASNFRKAVPKTLEKIELTYEDGTVAKYDTGLVVTVDGDALDIQTLNMTKDDRAAIVNALIIELARLKPSQMLAQRLKNQK